MTIVFCIKCQKKFSTRPSLIRMGWGKFCSRICHYENSRNRVEVSCSTCSRQILKSLSRMSNSKSGKFFCSKSCQTKWRNKVFSGEKHKAWKGRYFSYRRVLSNSDVPKRCSKCGNTDFRVLAVHHADGNHKNNNLSNLKWLCHNCHYLVHHGKVEK